MNRSRYIWVALLVVVFVIGAVVYFGSRGSRQPAHPSPSPSPAPTNSAAPESPSSDVVGVRVTIQGPVVANEQYRTGTISVDASQRVLTVYLTYTNQPVVIRTLPNNEEAFSQFYAALQTAGYTTTAKGDHDASVGSTCPTGKRYTYETLGSDGRVLSSLWATTCGTARQSFGGNVGLVNQLYRAQIPSLNQITEWQPLQF